MIDERYFDFIAQRPTTTQMDEDDFELLCLVHEIMSAFMNCCVCRQLL